MLISAIMPTHDRPQWLPMAIKCFLDQTWPEKELLILDDGFKPAEWLLPRSWEINYSYSFSQFNLGEKLNRLCASAKGDVIFRFDDDDWSHPGRISKQIGQLNASGADVTGYHTYPYFDVRTGKAFEYRHPKGGPYAAGGSLAFTKSWWKDHPFKKQNIGEDTFFSRDAESAGKLKSFEAGGMFVARIHGGNTAMNPGMLTGPAFREIDWRNLPADFFRCGAP
jgi:glycosyltransferase involved in cell wall biosynthesis